MPHDAMHEQRPGPASLTDGLLIELIHHLLRFERRIMDQLQELQNSVTDLTAAQADATAKVDVLIQKNDLLIDMAEDLEKRLVALGETGQIPPAALSDLISQIGNAKTAYQAIGSKADAESAKIDTELAADAPAPEPAPAPAPTDGTLPDSAPLV